MKNISEQRRKIIVRITTFLVVIIAIISNYYTINTNKTTETSNILEKQTMNEYNLEEDVISFINENNELFTFYANMFGISISDLKDAILNDNEGQILNKNNIGNTNTTYESLDMDLINYLFNLKKNNPKLFKQEYINANTYSKDYIYGLINYFSNVYGNVDSDVLSSIAYIETGNLNSKYMLKCNNIYGGIGSHGLIKYSNIEFGVLSYVKMMAKYYYAKGLDTVELIAKKYNPNSKTWVSNINKYKNLFENNSNIDLITLINLK